MERGGREEATRRKLLPVSKTMFGRRVRKLLDSNVGPQYKEGENVDGEDHEFQCLLLDARPLSSGKESSEGG